MHELTNELVTQGSGFSFSESREERHVRTYSESEGERRRALLGSRDDTDVEDQGLQINCPSEFVTTLWVVQRAFSGPATGGPRGQ